MDRVTVSVGLDYHQRSVQVCVMDATGRVLANRGCANDAAAIASVVERHGERVHAAVEACSGAADLADELVTRRGWSVHLAHPGYVARMKQSPDKTDFTDARMLADLVRVGYLPQVWLAPQEVRELRRLVRYRQQLVGQRRNLKLRVGALLRDGRVAQPPGCTWTARWIAWLQTAAALSLQSRWIVERQLVRFAQIEQDIRAVEKRLAEVTAGDVQVDQLLDQRGIGLITAVTLRAEIGRFDRFGSGKQLARFCGLSPRNASSGQRQADAGLIRAGNPALRAVLIQAAHRLVRYEPRWSRLASSLQRRGKPTCVTVVAVANRWMRWLYHQMTPALEAV